MPDAARRSPPDLPPAAGTQIQSLQRGMRILELVGRGEDGLTLPELARLMDLGKTTVHNLVRTLAVGGYLVRRTGPLRYALGPALFQLVGHRRLHALRERAAPILLELSRRHPGSAAVFAEPADADIRVTLRASQEQPGRVEHPVDRFIPAYTNATSLLFLAFWSTEQRRAYLGRHPFGELGAHFWFDEERLDAQLHRIRVQRYAVIDRSPSKAFPIAVPLFSESGELLAALALAYRSADKISASTKRELIERVQAAAARLAPH